ncbi:MAG: hypothetical protein ACP5UH_01660 [Candidatus Micrarchaeia archaeon]
MKSASSIISEVFNKYGIPAWIAPYAMKYARRNPLKTVKFAMSFVETKRKKGAVTNGYVVLPNGLRLKLGSLIKVLNAIFYEQDMMARIAKRWATLPVGYDPRYAQYASELSKEEARHSVAIKNLIEGLGYKISEPDARINELFEYISSLDTWQKRLIAVNIVLRDSYAKAFGLILYRVFYAVSPEYMRAFGKVFSETEHFSQWGFEEAKRVIQQKRIPESETLAITREIAAKVLKTIDFNMSIAKEAGIVEEIKLLRDIAIVYPFQTLKELGIAVDPNKELEALKKLPDKKPSKK